MPAQGYREVALPDPYEPSRRVRPCDACGAGLFVGESEAVVQCDGCRHQQAVPDAGALSIAASPSGDERERLKHLATQLDHQWLLPKSIVRFGGNVLEEEIGEAREVWAELRRRLEADPDDPDKALELMCVTFALHGAMPAQTHAQRLARRALAEASAEAQTDPLLRQKTLYNVVIGAVRAGELDHARTWLGRMDPRSRGLDADSSYRVAAAALATALDDPAQVLKLLGREAGAVPIHASSRGLAAMLRANALEKLGSLDAAVEAIYAEALERHSALARIAELVQSFPADWALCTLSLPLAMERDRDRLIANISARTGPAFPLALLALVLLAACAVALEGRYALAAGGAGAACALAAYLVVTRDTRRRREIVRGCVAVCGRILAMRQVGPGGLHELDVSVERDDLPDVRVTTVQRLGSRLQQMQLEGCAFDALWNAAHPTLFPRITINVSADDIERADRAKQGASD